MSADDNHNVYRHQWGKIARQQAGFPEETKAETLARLSKCTSAAGRQEYQRLLRKWKGGKKS